MAKANPDKVLKKIPDSELHWVKQLSGDKTFFITSNLTRDTYNLYLETADGFIKVASDNSPVSFDDVIKKHK